MPRGSGAGGSSPPSEVAAPELGVLARVPEDALELLRAHLPHGPGRHAHDQPSGRDDLARGHERSRADLGTLLDDGAVQHDGADTDAAVIHDRARVHDRAVADRHVVADDARVLRRNVEDRVVLDVRVLPEPHVVILVAAEHRERPDAGAGVDRHVTDDGRLRIDVRVGMDAWREALDLADHGAPPRNARTSSTTRSGASRIMKWPTPRSEEHTSELQSLTNLV